MMNFTLYTRDKYYGLESYDMFESQFMNYCEFYDQGLIHLHNIELLLHCIVKRRNLEQILGHGMICDVLHML